LLLVSWVSIKLLLVVVVRCWQLLSLCCHCKWCR